MEINEDQERNRGAAECMEAAAPMEPVAAPAAGSGSAPPATRKRKQRRRGEP